MNGCLAVVLHTKLFMLFVVYLEMCLWLQIAIIFLFVCGALWFLRYNIVLLICYTIYTIISKFTTPRLMGIFLKHIDLS